MEKSKRQRFSLDDDIYLLREVVTNNPIHNQDNWHLIQENLEKTVSKLFSIRTLKKHLQLLLELWLKKEKQVKSGGEEPYGERDMLLQEIKTMFTEEGNLKKQKKIPVEKVRSDIGKKDRENYAHNFTVDTDENEELIEEELVVGSEIIVDATLDHDYNEIAYSDKSKACDKMESTTEEQPREQQAKVTHKRSIAGPHRKRYNKAKTSRKDALTYLTEKRENDLEIRKRELDIEERKVNIEERKVLLQEQRIQNEKRKIEMEEGERQGRLKIEMEKFKIEVNERKTFFSLLERQQNRIEELLQKRLERHFLD